MDTALVACWKHGKVYDLWVKSSFSFQVTITEPSLSFNSVNSAVVQCYISPILEAALSQHPHTQAVAVDILTFTVKQGPTHPLQVCDKFVLGVADRIENAQSFPIIVALETSPNTATSVQANALHAIMYSKYASLLNAHFIISAKQSFDYQKMISLNSVEG